MKIINNVFSKKPFSILILAGSLFFLSACNNSKNETAESEVASQTMVQLNNGTKWKANAETTEGINNMIAIISKFQEGENAADYPLLKNTLEAEFKLIFDRCTMTGEAHDQLHNYLIPLKEMLSRLDSTDPTVISTAIADVDDHLQLYFEYFE